MRFQAAVMRFAVAAAAVCLASVEGATAADVKTPLTCKLGAAMESDHMLDITNTTSNALKKEAIINVDITTTGPMPGESRDCFALDAPLAAKAHISHKMTVHIAGEPSVCKAFVSSKIPAIVHAADGSATTDCDY